MKEIVKLQGVQKNFGKFQALKDVTFTSQLHATKVTRGQFYWTNVGLAIISSLLGILSALFLYIKLFFWYCGFTRLVFKNCNKKLDTTDANGRFRCNYIHYNNSH